MRTFLKSLFRRFFRMRVEMLSEDEKRVIATIPGLHQAVQRLLANQYREGLASTGAQIPLSDTEFRCFSQNGEDGILLYLFSVIGTTCKRAIEIGAGDGLHCNTANLIIHHGWDALLIDGSASGIERGRRFYAQCRDTNIWPPTLVHAWVTAENVNHLIRENGFAGEADLLSLDIDGMDYWILNAIDCVQPRVIVVEYQDILGPDRAVTVPYDSRFFAHRDGPANAPVDYSGASLPAFVKLARRRGYRLVGCQSYGFNAFFVRDDVAPDALPEIDVKSCFVHPKVRWGMRTRFPRVEALEWQEV